MVGFGQTLPRDVPLVQFAAAQGTALVSRPPADRGPRGRRVHSPA